MVSMARAARFELRAAAKVSGVVLTADGKPLPRMYVMVLDPEGGQLPHGGAADERGAFSLTVPAGEVVDLVVNGSRLAESMRGPYEITRLRGEAKGVKREARLRRGAGVRRLHPDPARRWSGLLDHVPARGLDLGVDTLGS